MGHVAAAKLFGEKLISWLPVFHRSWLKKRPVWLSGSSSLLAGQATFEAYLPNT